MGQCHCKGQFDDEAKHNEARPGKPAKKGANGAKGEEIPKPAPKAEGNVHEQVKVQRLSASEAEYAALVAMTNFAIEDIAVLREKFERVTQTQVTDGCIQRGQFLRILEQDEAKAPLIYNRVFDKFDYKKNGTIDFQEFVCGVSHFAPNAPEEEKINFAFKLFDLQEDAQIHKSEVKQILEPSLSNADIFLEDDQIDRMVDNTVSPYTEDPAGSLTYAQFFRLCKENPQALAMFNLPSITVRNSSPATSPVTSPSGAPAST